MIIFDVILCPILSLQGTRTLLCQSGAGNKQDCWDHSLLRKNSLLSTAVTCWEPVKWDHLQVTFGAVYAASNVDGGRLGWEGLCVLKIYLETLQPQCVNLSLLHTSAEWSQCVNPGLLFVMPQWTLANKWCGWYCSLVLWLSWQNYHEHIILYPHMAHVHTHTDCWDHCHTAGWKECGNSEGFQDEREGWSDHSCVVCLVVTWVRSLPLRAMVKQRGSLSPCWCRLQGAIECRWRSTLLWVGKPGSSLETG